MHLLSADCSGIVITVSCGNGRSRLPGTLDACGKIILDLSKLFDGQGRLAFHDKKQFITGFPKGRLWPST